MTHFEEIRRRLTKRHKIRGTKASAKSEGNTLEIEQSAGVGFEKIRIFGASHQPSVNFGEVYLDYFKNTSNYTGLVTGAFAIPLPSALVGKEMTFTVINTGATLANTLSLSDSDNPLFATSESLLTSSGEINTITSSKYTYLIIGNVMSSDEISAFWENYLLVATANEISATLPHPIYSSADKGMTLSLKSKNLLNVDKFVELVKKYNVYAYETTVDGRKCIAFMNNQMHGRDFTSCCPAFKENTRYIFSFIGRISTTNTENAQQTLSCGFKDVTSAQQTGNRVLSPLSDEWKRAYSINNANTTVTDIYMSYGSAAMWFIDLDSIYLYEYEGDTDPEYEPYFIEKIQIPSEVTLKDGAVVKIRLGKYKNADYIEIDKKARSVRYYEYTKAPDPTLPLSEQAENDEPSVYDLSNSDLAQELLSLSIPCYLNGSIEIIPNDEKMIPVSAIQAEYYSTSRDEMVTLTIDFIDTEGVKIQASKEYSVRRGARYLIISPHIDNYIPIFEKQEGIASDDTTISLIYKEDENV